MHHVIKRSQGGSDAPDNVVALCRACHVKTDAPYARGRLVIWYDEGFQTVAVFAADRAQGRRQASAHVADASRA